MRITEGRLRRIIRESLLQEEVFEDATAFVYTGSRSPPEVFLPLIAEDKLDPGKGMGGLYGKGLYTVHDLADTRTEKGFYGKYIYKLKVDLQGFLCFDKDVAAKVYGKPLTVIEQMRLLGVSEEIITASERVIERVPGDEVFTAKHAQPISVYVRGLVKGLVFTGENDGRVVVIYDASTVTPVAYKMFLNKGWKRASEEAREKTADNLKSDWRKERYEENSIEKLKRLRSRLTNPRSQEDLVIQGDLDLTGGSSAGLPGEMSSGISEIPAGLQVSGNLVLHPATETLPPGLVVGGSLSLFGTLIRELPPNMQVGGNLILSQLITEIPPGLKVGGGLYCRAVPITEIPDDIQVGGDLDLERTEVVRLPENLTVNGDLNLMGTPIRDLPAGLHVTGRLELKGSAVERIPDDLEADDGIYLSRSFKSYNVPQRLMKGYRKDGRQKVWFT